MGSLQLIPSLTAARLFVVWTVTLVCLLQISYVIASEPSAEDGSEEAPVQVNNLWDNEEAFQGLNMFDSGDAMQFPGMDRDTREPATLIKLLEGLKRYKAKKDKEEKERLEKEKGSGKAGDEKLNPLAAVKLNAEKRKSEREYAQKMRAARNDPFKINWHAHEKPNPLLKTRSNIANAKEHLQTAEEPEDEVVSVTQSDHWTNPTTSPVSQTTSLASISTSTAQKSTIPYVEHSTTPYPGHYQANTSPSTQSTVQTTAFLPPTTEYDTPSYTYPSTPIPEVPTTEKPISSSTPEPQTSTLTPKPQTIALIPEMTTFTRSQEPSTPSTNPEQSTSSSTPQSPTPTYSHKDSHSQGSVSPTSGYTLTSTERPLPKIATSTVTNEPEWTSTLSPPSTKYYMKELPSATQPPPHKVDDIHYVPQVLKNSLPFERGARQGYEVRPGSAAYSQNLYQLLNQPLIPQDKPVIHQRDHFYSPGIFDRTKWSSAVANNPLGVMPGDSALYSQIASQTRSPPYSEPEIPNTIPQLSSYPQQVWQSPRSNVAPRAFNAAPAAPQIPQIPSYSTQWQSPHMAPADLNKPFADSAYQVGASDNSNHVPTTYFILNSDLDELMHHTFETPAVDHPHIQEKVNPPPKDTPIKAEPLQPQEPLHFETESLWKPTGKGDYIPVIDPYYDPAANRVEEDSQVFPPIEHWNHPSKVNNHPHLDNPHYNGKLPPEDDDDIYNIVFKLKNHLDKMKAMAEEFDDWEKSLKESKHMSSFVKDIVPNPRPYVTPGLDKTFHKDLENAGKDHTVYLPPVRSSNRIRTTRSTNKRERPVSGYTPPSSFLSQLLTDEIVPTGEPIQHPDGFYKPYSACDNDEIFTIPKQEKNRFKMVNWESGLERVKNEDPANGDAVSDAWPFQNASYQDDNEAKPSQETQFSKGKKWYVKPAESNATILGMVYPDKRVIEGSFPGFPSWNYSDFPISESSAEEYPFQSLFKSSQHTRLWPSRQIREFKKQNLNPSSNQMPSANLYNGDYDVLRKLFGFMATTAQPVNPSETRSDEDSSQNQEISDIDFNAQHAPYLSGIERGSRVKRTSYDNSVPSPVLDRFSSLFGG